MPYVEPFFRCVLLVSALAPLPSPDPSPHDLAAKPADYAPDIPGR